MTPTSQEEIEQVELMKTTAEDLGGTFQKCRKFVSEKVLLHMRRGRLD